MSTRILHKRNATANTPPQAADLAAGELAFNTADGKLYLKRDDNTIIDVSQSIFQRDTKFTVVDDGGVNPSTITGEIDGVQKLQIDAGGIIVDGTVDINSAETLFFNDSDNNEYVGVSAPDTVDYSYIFKLPNTLPIDKGILTITPDGQTTWGEVDPFDGFTIYVSEEFGDDSADGEHNPVKSIKRAAQLASSLGLIPDVEPTEAELNAKRLIEDNKEFLIEETIGYVNTTYPSLTYTENTWRRQLQKAIEAVQFDIFLGGNSASVSVGEESNSVITNQTEYVDALSHLSDITVNVIKNEDPATSYQALIEQVKYPQIDASAEESNVIAEYTTISDIITNDVSPAVVEAQFTRFPVTIKVAGGEFEVDNPVILADKVTIQSQSSRGAILRPKNANVDLFRVRDASGLINVTLRDGIDVNGDPSYTWDWALGYDDPTDASVDRLGYFGLPATKPVIETPPLVQNVLLISFLGGNGLDVDGSKVERPAAIPEPEPRRLILRGFGFAFATFNGIGVRATNDGHAQLSSCTFSFCSESMYAQSGGFIEVSNSGSNFGIYGLRASGYRSESFNVDRGLVVDTGLINGEQFIRLIGAGRFPLEEYVIRLRDATTGTDLTSNFKNPSATNTFDASTDVNASTDEITIASHGYITGDAVQYSAEGNPVIPGLTDGTVYYISEIDANTIKLFNDESLTFAVDITGTSTGTHEFASNVEEFFVQRRQDLHWEYQELVTEPGSFAFQPGDLILGDTGGLTNTAYVYSYDDTTDTLIVSVEETNGTRVYFDNTSTITDIDGSTVSIAVNSATNVSQEYRTATIIVDSTVPASTVQNLSTAEGLEIRLHRPSTVNATSHVWEYVGAGTDFGALDEVLCCSLQNEFRFREDLPGRVYSVGSDERGDYVIGGGLLQVQNRSGRVIFNNTAEANQLSVVELTMTGASINEISTDTGLGDNEPGGAQNSRLTTQRAIRSFIANRLDDVLDKTVSSASVPGALVQLNSQGQINSDLLPPGRGISTFPVNGFEERLNVSNEIPGISLNTGDQVAETYEQQILQLTGTVTIAKGSEVVQQNTGATGYAKEDYTSESTITLVGPLSGTFNTSDELEDDGSALGANSVPTSIGSRDTVTDNYFLARDNESQFLKLDPNVTYDFTGVTSVSASRNEAEGDITSGPITGVVGAVDSNTLAGGSGYTPGSGEETYEFVSLTGGSGTGAIADITVEDGEVTAVDMRRGGSGYAVSDTLSANAADIGGTGSGFSIDVASVQTRLFVDLTGQNIKFEATESVPEYIEDANSPTLNITDFEDFTQYAFDAESTGGSGDVDYSANQITITGHGYTNGDTSEYDDNGNGPIPGLTVGTTYWVKVIDANTIELYNDYALSSGSQVVFNTPAATGVHNLTRYVVDTNVSTFYIPAHGASTGTAIKVEAADPPAPIQDGDHYFVGSVTTNGFTIHATRSDAIASVAGATINPVALSDRGTGSGSATVNDVVVLGVVNTSSTELDNWNIISQQTIDAANVVSGILSTSRLGTGTANDTTFLRGDSTWARAVQNIRTPEPSPLNISGDFFNDGSNDLYYNSLEISIDRASTGNPDPTFTTLGVAAFNKNQFTVNSGQVSVTSNVINAGTLNGNNGAYYLDPLNLSATVPVSKGGTGLTTYTQGDIIISGAANSLTQLNIGAPNTVLTSNGSIPAWSASLTLAGTLTVAGVVSANNTTESTSTSTGGLKTLGGLGVAKNANIGGNATVTGNMTVNGTSTTLNTDTVTTQSKTVEVADGSADATAADGSGLVVDLGSSGTASMLYDSTTDAMTVNRNFVIDVGVTGDSALTIRADSDDNNEGDHPSIRLKQDGDNVDYRIGLGATDTDTGSNANNVVITGIAGGSNAGLKFSPDNGSTVNTVFHDGYHPNADTLTTARTISVSGAVTGSVAFDGSGNVDITTTATSDPTLTLTGDVSGSATFTNLGNASLAVTIADDSHNHVISNVDGLQSALDSKIDDTEKGAAFGVATLDANALVPASQLPSFVDDVEEYADLGSFPGTGETGKIYVALDTNKAYRWSGSQYVYITSGAVDSVAGKTGVVTLSTSDVTEGSRLYFTNARAISAIQNDPSWNATDWDTAFGWGDHAVEGYENQANKGVANGYASLDGNAKVPASQLPSFVDDVLEYANTGTFPGTGELGKIYVAQDTGDIYRWSGSQYIKISDAVSTADEATKLATARTIALGGDLSGSTSFDGTTNVTITATVADDSHNHIIANVDGLQSALNSKLDNNAKAVDSDLLDGQDSTFYRNASNLNAGTINDARLPGTISSDITGNAATADAWSTARTISLTGAVTGSTSIDGSGNVSISTTATSDPTLTINGDVSGSATFTNLGNATLTATVANDSHTHQFNNLTGKEAGGGNYSTTGNLESGRGSGGVALTINDSQGNANVTFNHANGVAEQAGNVGRITVNTDSTTGASMGFQLASNAAAGTVNPAQIMSITPGGLSVDTGNLTVSGTISGNGSGITNLNFNNISSNIPDPTLTLSGDATGSATFTNLGNATLSVNVTGGNVDTANTLATARTISLSGAVTGSTSFDGSGNVSISTTATSDPTLTLSGDASGSATFTNLGNATLSVNVTGGNADTLDSINSTQFLRSDTTDTASGWLTFTNSNGLETQYGIQGGYGDSNSSGSDWGANIWAMGNAYMGSGTGPSFSPGGYQIAWLRGSNAAALSVVNEGSYIYSQNSRIAAFGVSGHWFSGTVRATGDMVAYYSDERLKDFHGTIPNALEKVTQLNGYYYTENDLAKTLGYDNDKRQLGVSAQEVQKVFPEAVEVAPISYDDNVDEEYLTVKYEKLVPGLIEAIKEQQKQIEALTKEIEELKRKP